MMFPLYKIKILLAHGSCKITYDHPNSVHGVSLIILGPLLARVRLPMIPHGVSFKILILGPLLARGSCKITHDHPSSAHGVSFKITKSCDYQKCLANDVQSY